MKTNRLLFPFLAAAFVLAAPGVRADEEQDLIATLQSAAAAPAKCAACQRLRLVGTVKSVPALAALLGEERTSHAARYALEGMPFPEAVTALRQALGATSGPIKAGLIDSLGWRHDAAAVPLLTPLLSDADTMIAAAAASALGRIGGRDAIGALVSAAGPGPPCRSGRRDGRSAALCRGPSGRRRRQRRCRALSRSIRPELLRTASASLPGAAWSWRMPPGAANSSPARSPARIAPCRSPRSRWSVN